MSGMVFPRHGGDLAWAAGRYGVAPEALLDFSANVNPLGPPLPAIFAAREALSEMSRYPEPAASSLRDELASRLGLEPGKLVLGNGSTELIHLVAEQARPRAATVLSPAFAEYEAAALRAGAEVTHLRLDPGDGFHLDAEALACLASRSQLTYTCNPASPTGRLYGRDELLPALEACRSAGGMLVVDESFMGFCPGEEARRSSLLGEAGGEGLVVVSTFTKLYALAGLRGPGWMAGPRGLMSALEERAVPWRVNCVAMAAARASLEDATYLEETRARVAEWRKALARGLERTGIFHVFPSSANFLLLRMADRALGAEEVVEGLGRRGILVRSCGNFRGLEEGFIRVAVRTPADNEKLLRALDELREDIWDYRKTRRRKER